MKKNNKTNTPTSIKTKVSIINRDEIQTLFVDKYQVAGRKDGFIVISGFQHYPESHFVEQTRQIITTKLAKEFCDSINKMLEKMEENTETELDKEEAPEQEK